ncbi:putative TetR family transcriptional regulator [Gordonia rhizosphera NBRC 16068]|uniref:Putative TetR family transcriptional regulator n=2 Tax=Gordonia rhizosphera TaxID=83341 RepID=K6WTP1_9ACTN|nr:putative TetR family transcriptional regulator [Gordonia rhizosphera NBRC 16068]
MLLDAAEVMFAEHGIASVSNRQISEAAGQGNNYAVGYHFGTKTELVRAILHHHSVRLDEIRARITAEVGEEADIRDWLRCLIQPQVEYLGTLRRPSHFARFCVQVASEPTMANLLYEEAFASEAISRILDGFYGALPGLPAGAVEVRDLITRNSIIVTLADLERALNGEEAPDWRALCEAMIDAMVGMWSAPAS